MDEDRTNVNSAGVPLMAGVARRILEKEVFPRQAQWRRADLAAEVDRIHLARGGAKGVQDTVSVVKKALKVLLEDGKVESLAYGLWRWKSPEGYPQSAPATDAESLPTLLTEPEVEEIVAERQVGEGPETVYVYYNPNDKKLADFEGRATWECKIGRTAAADPIGRIVGQGAKTALSRLPAVGLVIRSQDSAALEKALHASLRLLESEVEDSPGTEWFMTSPGLVEAWYSRFLDGLSALRGRKGEPG